MANKECVLFRANAAWDLQSSPVPGIQKLDPIVNEPTKLCSQNKAGSTRLNAFISKAIWEVVRGKRSDICVIRVGNGTYASECKQPDGSFVVAYASSNGELNAALVPESKKRFAAVPELGNPSDNFDTSSILACYLMMIMDAAGTSLAEEVKKDLEEAKATFEKSGGLPTDELYRIGDALQVALNEGVLLCKIPQGGIDLLAKSRVTSGAFSGEIICGRSELLMPGFGMEGSLDLIKLEDAMKRFAPYADQTAWGPEELARIPDLPGDMYVPTEALEMIQWYVETKDSKLPAVNFMWRGITGSGKSTGVKLMAKILRKPLYIMTCYTNMETGDFLSTLVPASKPNIAIEEMPGIDDIFMDPEFAFEQLTGEKVPGVSSQAVLEKYAEVYAAATAQQGSESYFKRVEAEFVKGLRRGGIVEIQECSRIRDSGVLVGLNEYDHAGALIPLIDGEYATRSPGAITVWTDNIGYASCRPVDPSVMRRMASVTDTFELSKATIVSRCLYNIDNALDKDKVGALYEVWNEIRSYCQKEEITEADVSPSDFENWVLHLSRCGMQDISDSCRKCIVAKTTTDRDTQERIQDAVAEPAIAKYIK